MPAKAICRLDLDGAQANAIRDGFKVKQMWVEFLS